MQRRRFLKFAAVGGLSVVGVGAAGAVAVRSRDQPFLKSFADVEAWLDHHATAEPAMTSGWPFATVLGHCAQSIEFSLTGFPELKSATFRSVVGPTVFGAFSALGGTRHGLSDLVPGTHRADIEGPFAKNLERFRAAIASFRKHEGAFAPHFAYGALDREQEERAHAMHFSEHLSEVAAAT